MAFLTIDDLAPFATIDPVKAAAMIEDAEAMAVLAAPCITDPEFSQRLDLVAGLKAILRGAILRWNEAGTGAKTQTQYSAGSFQVGGTVDTSQPRRGMFWPSEITQLQDLCAVFNGSAGDKAFMVNMIPADGSTGNLASRPDLWFQWLHPTPPGAP